MKILLVEGVNDKIVIGKLLKRRKIEFENFDINDCHNVHKLLHYLPKTIELRTYEDVIGVIVDADEDLAERWQTLEVGRLKTTISVPQFLHPV